MTILVGKADDFVLKTWAITWANTVDTAVVQWRKVFVVQNYLLGLFRSVGKVATALCGWDAIR